MRASDALGGCERIEVRQPAPIFLYDDLTFDSLCVAEPESAWPMHRGRLVRLLRRKGKSREDAEDLVQEAMLRLHLYEKSDVVVNEEAFLKHAVHNLAIDHYRRDRSIVSRQVQIEDVERQHPLIAPSPTPDQVFDSQQRLDRLTALLDAVSRRTREIYFAHRAGYTHAEIANEMGIADKTVKRHISRAHLIILNQGDG